MRIGGNIRVISFSTTYLLANFVDSFVILQNVVRSYSISNRSLCSASSRGGLRIVQTKLTGLKLIDILWSFSYNIWYEITKAKCGKNDPKPSG